MSSTEAPVYLSKDRNIIGDTISWDKTGDVAISDWPAGRLKNMNSEARLKA